MATIAAQVVKLKTSVQKVMSLDPTEAFNVQSKNLFSTKWDMIKLRLNRKLEKLEKLVKEHTAGFEPMSK